MLSTTPKHRTLDTVDLDLPGARVLRANLYRDADGEPETLNLVTGWSGPFRPDDRRPISIPGYLLPELRAALEALEIS